MQAIEKGGTGTPDMISLCKAGGLPTPQFRQDGGQFIQTLRRPAKTGQVTGQVTVQVAVNILAHCRGLRFQPSFSRFCSSFSLRPSVNFLLHLARDRRIISQL